MCNLGNVYEEVKNFIDTIQCDDQMNYKGSF